MTYAQLNQHANALAHRLIEHGVGPDVLVGIAIERSLEMVIGLLAILKAEMDKTRAGGKSELMDLLIAYKWKDMFGGFDRDPASIEWVKPESAEG